jgi:hypothetical protein
MSVKEQSIESILARQRLQKLKDGESVTYDELAVIIGKNPQTSGYGMVMTARRQVEREQACVLECITNVGLKRVVPREVVNRGGRDLKHIRRSTKRAMHRQATLADDQKQAEMNNEERKKYSEQFSQLGILAHMQKPAQRKKIAVATESAARALPPADALALFLKPKDVGTVQ